MTTYRTLKDERRPLPFAGQADWEQQAAWLQRQIAVCMGQLPAPPEPALRSEVFGRWTGPDYTCEKVAVESLPGFYVTGNLFRPLKPSGPTPVILSPHGHWPDGRLHDHDVKGSVPRRCIHLARMGCAVFSYDMTGYNDSCQLGHHSTPEDSLWGFGMMALQTWNSRIALDFVLGLPDIDPTRVGITGASGGGTQSFIMMALDRRLTAAAPINMISLEMQGGCVCENAPLLRLHATNVDIAALFAPKPLFLGSCTGDWTHLTPERERPAIERVYGLYDAIDQVDGIHVDAGHNYNAATCEGVYGFFQRTFRDAKSKPPLENPYVPMPSLRERMVWWGRQAPQALDAARIHALWQERQAAALAPILQDPQRIRQELVPLLPHVLGLDAHGEPLPSDHQLEVSLANGTLTVSGPPPASAFPGDVQHASCYNNPPFLEQVHAISQALRETGSTRLVGENGAGPACLLAATQAVGLVSLEADLTGFVPDDHASWQATFPVPYIRQIGGLATIQAALKERQITTKGLSD